MARNKLSEFKIRSLTKPGIYGDGDGLWLRVQKGGSKNWIFIFRRGSIRNELGLGGYGQGTAPVTLVLAREKAEAIREQLARARAPAAKRSSLRSATFKDCVDAFLSTKQGEWDDPKHTAQWRMTLLEYAKPLHPLVIADITVGDVEACLLPHCGERPETADRLRNCIRSVIDYAIAREWRTQSAATRRKELLDKILPAQAGRLAIRP